MNISKLGLAEIVSYEGIVLSPYYDTQRVLTFGIGHTRFSGKPRPEDLPMGVDQPLDFIFNLFQEKIKSYVKEVNSALGVVVTQPQFDALVSFHYNTGAIKRATLTRFLNEGQDKHVIAHAFMMWTKNKELIPRRTAEARLFEYGVYKHHGEATVYQANIHGKIMYSTAKQINSLDYLK